MGETSIEEQAFQILQNLDKQEREWREYDLDLMYEDPDEIWDNPWAMV